MAVERPSAEILRRALQTVRENFEDAKGWRPDLESDWADWYDQYRGILTKRHLNRWQSRSRLFVYETYHDVETILPRIVEGVLGTDPPFEVQPREEQDVASAEKMAGLLRYQLQRMRNTQLFQTTARSALIYGTSYQKIGWENAIVKVGKKEGTDEKFIVPYEGPKAWPLSISDLFVPRSAIGLQPGDGSCVVHRFYRTYDELKSRERAGMYFGVDDLPRPTTGLHVTDDDLLRMRRGLSRSSLPTPKDEPWNRYEVLEYWGLFSPSKDEEPEEWVITTVGLTTVIRAQPNPYWGWFRPFLRMTPLFLEGEFYGIGIPESIQDSQTALNALVNIRFDNLVMAMQRMFVVTGASGIQLKQITPRPWGVIKSEDPNGVRPLDVPDITASAFTETAMLQEGIRRTTGATSALTGEFPSKRATASEVASNVSEAGQRLSTTILNAESFFHEQLEMLAMLNYQFLRKEQAIRILGPEGAKWDTVSPEDVRHLYDIVPVGSRSTMSRAVKQAQLLQFLQIAPQVQQVLVQNLAMEAQGIQSPVNWKVLLRRVLEGFGITNPGEILRFAGSYGAETPPPAAGGGILGQALLQMMSQAGGGAETAGVPGLGPSSMGVGSDGSEIPASY